MLIRFYVANFLSFAEKTEFSMIAAKNLPRDDQVLTRTDPKVLRSSILYGANASGKSNLVKAIDRARKMILNPPQKGRRLQDQRFRLSHEYSEEPTHFEFEFFSNGTAYAYGFTFTPDRIVEEWLFKISNCRDVRVFERNGSDVNMNDKHFRDKKSRDRLYFAFEDLLPNQLFLSVVSSRNTRNLKGGEVFEEVYDWFHNKLTVIFPESRFSAWENIEKDEEFRALMKGMLSSFDTGIHDISFRERRREELSEGDIPKQVLDDIEANAPEDVVMITGSRYNSFLVDVTEAGLRIRELCTTHDSDHGPVDFRIVEESDGTKRLTDFIPMFAATGPTEKTFVVDEIDRSLHTDLNRKLLHMFLHSDATNRRQLIATTHDVALLDLDLLRRDEIWFVEKNKGGASTLYSLQDFKPRKDLDIRNAYLQGRFGAVPLIQDNESLQISTR